MCDWSSSKHSRLQATNTKDRGWMREGSLQKSYLIELYPTERPKSSSNSVKNLSLGEINWGKCAQVDATVSVCVSKFSFASSWHDIFRIYFWPRKNGKENSITNINTQLSEKLDDMSVAGLFLLRLLRYSLWGSSQRRLMVSMHFTTSQSDQSALIRNLSSDGMRRDCCIFAKGWDTSLPLQCQSMRDHQY